MTTSIERAQGARDVVGWCTLLWDSPDVMALIVDEDGGIVAASPGLELAVGRELAGGHAAELVAPQQVEALTGVLKRAEHAWSPHLFGLAVGVRDVPLDVSLSVRRYSAGVLVVMRPAGEAPLMDIVDDLVTVQRQLAQRNGELERALAALETARREVAALSSMVPICAWCRRIREDDGQEAGETWLTIEQYLESSGAGTTHAICGPCLEGVERAAFG